MKTHPSLAFIALALLANTPSVVAENSDVDELKAMVREMQKTIAEQNARIATLENQKADQVAKPPAISSSKPIAKRTPAPLTTKPQVAALASPPDEVPPTATIPQHRSAARDADMFEDLQQAAARLNNAPLDPKLKGFIPIPGTQSMVKIGGSARIDSIVDFANNGNPNLFTPSSIPVRGEPGWDGGERTAFQSKATRLSFEIRRPAADDGNLRIYYENDFFNDSTSSTMNYRVRHLYGQAWNFLIGQTYSAFQDIDVFPDVVDYQGPNGIVNRRQPQIRYTHPIYDHGDENFQLFASVELPEGQLDTDNNTSGVDLSAVNHTPDGVVGFLWEGPLGHVKGASLFRDLSYESDAGPNGSTFGWGVTLSGALNVCEDDKLMAQVTYGQGVARYINDLSGENLDAAIVNGNLEAIPVFAVMTGYTHSWSEQWRSTISCGYVHVDVPNSLDPFTVEDTIYSSLNLMWHPTTSFRMGLEYLYGFKQTLDGSDADANRLNFVVRYDLVR